MRALPTAGLATLLAASACSEDENKTAAPPGGTSKGGSGGSKGSGGDTDGGGTGGPDAGTFDCGEVALGFSAIAPDVMLVLDASGSMSSEWDHDGLPSTDPVTRWSTLHFVVEGIVEKFGAELNLGVIVYPSQGACEVNPMPLVPVGPDNGAIILAAIPAADELVGGGTPTTAAIEVSAGHLSALMSDGLPSMVLVTDGYPGCVGPDAAIEAITVAHEQLAIDTYVVGIGIEGIAIDTMEAMAEAGGVPATTGTPYYRGDDQMQLQQALDDVASSISRCRARLPRLPDDPDNLIVRQGNQPIPQVDDCDTEDGWSYVHASGPYDEVDLCGSYCEDLELEEVVAVFPCTPGK